MDLMKINSIDDCQRRIIELQSYKMSLIKDFYTKEVLENFVQELLDKPIIAGRHYGNATHNFIFDTVYGAMIAGESNIDITHDKVYSLTEGYEAHFRFNYADTDILSEEVLDFIEDRFDLCGPDGMGHLPSPCSDRFRPTMYEDNEYDENGYYVCEYYYADEYIQAMKDLYVILKRRQEEVRAKIYKWYNMNKEK